MSRRQSRPPFRPALRWLDRARRVVQRYGRCDTRGNLRGRFPLHIEPWRHNISGCEWQGRHRTSRDHNLKRSCGAASLAPMAPLEFGVATFQSPSEQREKRSHGSHIDERQHESGLFRLQTSSRMKMQAARRRHLSAADLHLDSEARFPRGDKPCPTAYRRCCFVI